MSGAKRARNPRGGKRKKKKDPNAPKRPRSAYILYCTDSREEVKKANDGAKPAELMQMMGAMWNALPAHKKQEYNDKAKEDKARYIEQMKGYTAPEEDDDDEDDGGSRRKRGKKKDPSEPKRSPSAYLLYGTKVREEVKAENPEAKSSEIMKLIGAKWQKLNEEQKKPYTDEAAQLKSQYDDAKASFKKKSSVARDDDGKDDDGDDGEDGGGDDDGEDDGGDDDDDDE